MSFTAHGSFALLVLRAQDRRRWNQRALAVVLAHEAAYRGDPHPSGGRWPSLLEAREP